MLSTVVVSASGVWLLFFSAVVCAPSSDGVAAGGVGVVLDGEMPLVRPTYGSSQRVSVYSTHKTAVGRVERVVGVHVSSVRIIFNITAVVFGLRRGLIYCIW